MEEELNTAADWLWKRLWNSNAIARYETGSLIFFAGRTGVRRRGKNWRPSGVHVDISTKHPKHSKELRHTVEYFQCCTASKFRRKLTEIVCEILGDILESVLAAKGAP